MKCNINQKERILRVFLSLLIGGLGLSGYLNDKLVSQIFLCVSAVILLTVVMNFCPIYRFLGISTNKSGRMTY